MELTVLGFDDDAWPEVRAANPFNEPPAEGKRMVMVRLRIRNVDSPQEPATWLNMYAALLGSYQRPWTPFGEASWCGVVPESLDVVELYHGGEAEGNLCFQIPADEIDLLLRYEYTWGKYVYLSVTPGE
ncbi:MAG: hypothetical protein H5T59_10190 [Anaerolineae bacterium]|nr:hypothetical protein [Anaerolineae bacterium]